MVIKNYRSIKDTSLELLDSDIATLIGANGSGKSNILKALISLKGDNSTPSDRDFHAKDGASNDPIHIAATFALEKRDIVILEAAGLKGVKLDGFIVTVEKKQGEDPTIAHEPIGYVDRQAENIQRIQKEIVRLVKSLTLEESQKEVVQNCIAKFEQEIKPDSAQAEATIQGLTAAFDTIKEINTGITEKVLNLIAEMKPVLLFDVDSRLKKVFAGLNIELLELNSYKIEDRAPIAELQDRTTHPFLYDLLKLGGKKATDFTPNHTPTLSRIKTNASKNLSTAISNVWLSHGLSFQIDKHAESLEFMVLTPQGHQVSLTDLSDGEQWFLKFYVRLVIAQKEGRQIIWLFDEPGRDLHTSSQIDLKGFFEAISEDAQVIYTSHLAMMLPWHRLERIFAVENSENEGTIVHKRFWKDSQLDSPLKEALSTFVGEELLGGKEHLIVEGVSDYFFLHGWLRHFQMQDTSKPWVSNYALYKRIFVPVDGVEKIPLYCWFLGRQVKKSINWVVIVDSSAEAESTAKKMTETGLATWTKNVKSVGDLAGAKKGAIEEIEGVFKPEEYIKVFEAYYAKEYQKCKLPTQAEILEKHKSESKITKAIGELLAEKNPTEITAEGKPIALDKTGIAQYVYQSLSSGSSSLFGQDTEGKFVKIFENLEKFFNYQIDDKS